jgi:hypothetical protein
LSRRFKTGVGGDGNAGPTREAMKMKSGLATMAAMLLMATTPVPVPIPNMGDLGWMAGAWAQDEGGEWTEENWSDPRGGIMIGHSRSGAGEKTQAFEFLMLQPGADGTPTYVARPGGGAPVAFRLIERGATSATFENVAHDYPQRIRYVRDGDTMIATISRIDGSKAMSWTYRRR